MKLKESLLAAGLAVAMCMATNTVMAQAGGGGGGGGFGGRRGNFNPAQFQQRMMDNIRQAMGVTKDDEWNVIEPKVQKVLDARREVGGGRGFGRMMFRGRRGGNNNNNNGGRRRGGFFGAPSPELQSLQNAIDNNAPTAQIKAALEKYRAARKVKEAALEKAQQDLKSVLTVKQEAVAVTMDLIP